MHELKLIAHCLRQQNFHCRITQNVQEHVVTTFVFTSCRMRKQAYKTKCFFASYGL